MIRSRLWCLGYSDHTVDLDHETDSVIEMHVVAHRWRCRYNTHRAILEQTRETVEELRETIAEREKILERDNRDCRRNRGTRRRRSQRKIAGTMLKRLSAKKHKTINHRRKAKTKKWQILSPKRGQTASYAYSSDSSDSSDASNCTKFSPQIPWQAGNNTDSHLQTESA